MADSTPGKAGYTPGKAGKWAASGAALGLFGGPIGAAVGASVGALGGFIWNVSPDQKEAFADALMTPKSSSEDLEREVEQWQGDHTLCINNRIRDLHLPLVDKFGATLQLAWKWCHTRVMGQDEVYYHYFVTDGVYTLEFGNGKLSENTVEIHSRRLPREYRKVVSFPNTDAVRERMKEVVGAEGYSLLLRNCEHAARYVYCGSWVCTQIVPNGLIRELLGVIVKNKMRYIRKKLNRPPRELTKPLTSNRVLFPGVQPIVQYETQHTSLSVDARDMFNIVFMGPSGSGKSSIINHLFNQ